MFLVSQLNPLPALGVEDISMSQDEKHIQTVPKFDRHILRVYSLVKIKSKIPLAKNKKAFSFVVIKD